MFTSNLAALTKIHAETRNDREKWKDKVKNQTPSCETKAHTEKLSFSFFTENAQKYLKNQGVLAQNGLH